ncbi:MAG: hypothetical protein IJ748_05490 [Bacteroidales bacterium]|nr:hypothetical protein [Bacteroidales bacterium]
MERQEERIERLFNCMEAAKELNLSLTTFYKIRKREEIKQLGITGKYFSLAQLKAIQEFLIHKSRF